MSAWQDSDIIYFGDQTLSIRELKHFIVSEKIDRLLNKLHKQCVFDKDGSGYYEYMFSTLEYTNNVTVANIIRDLCEQLNASFYSRYKRLRDRISDMFDIFDCTFVTLTFEDKYLDSSLETKREYCKRFLSSFEMPYVANVDYGSQNGRIHFHAVIACPREQLEKEPWHYGFQYLETCRTDTDDEKRLSKYVAKLSAHALKSTTKNSRLIYSRNFDKLLSDYIKKSLQGK